jgi:hypothetical protein
MVCVAIERKIRMVIENPYSVQSYMCNNFIIPPSVIDRNRNLRGDYFIKPTAYWFVNCEPTNGFSLQKDKDIRTIRKSKSAGKQGLCSEERSMIHPDYARNFINDFILGRTSEYSQLNLFNNN